MKLLRECSDVVHSDLDAVRDHFLQCNDAFSTQDWKILSTLYLIHCYENAGRYTVCGWYVDSEEVCTMSIFYTTDEATCGEAVAEAWYQIREPIKLIVTDHICTLADTTLHCDIIGSAERPREHQHLGKTTLCLVYKQRPPMLGCTRLKITHTNPCVWAEHLPLIWADVRITVTNTPLCA